VAVFAQAIRLGSTRVSRVGFGVAPEQAFVSKVTRQMYSSAKKKFRDRETRLPARETRALRRIRSRTNGSSLTVITYAEKNRAAFRGAKARNVSGWDAIWRTLSCRGRFVGQANEILGRNLSNIAWDGPIDELTKTSNCQPALYIHSLASLAVLREIAGDFPVAGAAGLFAWGNNRARSRCTFDFGTGLKLVQRRAEFMDQACAATLGAWRR